MRVKVNFEVCEANGLCMAAAPEVFELDDNEVLHVLMEEPDESLEAKVRTAVRTCPKQAVSIV